MILSALLYGLMRPQYVIWMILYRLINCLKGRWHIVLTQKKTLRALGTVLSGILT
ncbi:unnamed protein product [Amoebophrya sp. A25]|nr:unnamed protein product [Amoebophrya sp. A25]|eukprot:GSA25T00007449001.1